MSYSVTGTIIKNKSEYNFWIADSYAWSKSDHVGFLLDWDKMIYLIKNYGEKDKDKNKKILNISTDNFIDFNTIIRLGLNETINNYYNAIIEKIEFKNFGASYNATIIIDLNKKKTIVNGETITFEKSKIALFNYIFKK